MKSLNLIAQAIYDKKGFNILVLNISHMTTLADYLIIAEGHIDRHLHAIADEIVDRLKKEGVEVSFVEGKESGGWVVIDLIDVLVHLFIPSLRQKYQLEKLWQNGQIVDIDIVP